MKAEELDEKFDRGEDVTAFLDLSKARRPEEEKQRESVPGCEGRASDPLD